MPDDLPLSIAAQALARGDAASALSSMGAREDPHALAVRGIALAQLEEWPRARELLERAVAAFNTRETARFRARALAALGVVDAALNDLAPAIESLAEAAQTLRRHGAGADAAWARLIEARLRAIGGDVAAAHRAIDEARHDAIQAAGSRQMPVLRAAVSLAMAQAAMRELRPRDAKEALSDAAHFAAASAHPQLRAEVDRRQRAQGAKIARVESSGAASSADASELVALFARVAARHVVDVVRRRVLVDGTAVVDLAARPVLCAVLAAIARRWPSAASAGEIIAEAYGVRRPNASHHTKLRAAIGKLRARMRGWGAIVALPAAAGGGWRWAIDRHGAEAFVVDHLLIDPEADPEAEAELEAEPAGAAPSDDAQKRIRALLGDGLARSIVAIARAARLTQRSTRGALATLREADAVVAIGEGKAALWARVTAADRLASQMLLRGVAGG